MRIFALLFLLTLTACAGEQRRTPTFHPEETPQQLSDWGMVFAESDRLIVNDGVTPYDLATPLFTDYALKLRTVWLPDGETATYTENDTFDFPVGAVITKTFYYPKRGDAVEIGVAPPLADKYIPLDEYRIMETRVLVHRNDGWAALPYVWNEDQTDAILKRTGDVEPMTLARGEEEIEFAYVVPNANQCAACHATNSNTREVKPIGPKARHLNKQSSYSPGFNQLDHWIASGLLTAENAGDAPANAIWTDEDAPLDARARAYLDINCSHCHSPVGAADTSGLNLEPDAEGATLGICKPPIAAGGGTGGRRYAVAPGAPDESITLFRLETTDPAAMMPELGRSLSHDEGVQLIREWISQMDGACG